MTQRAPKRDFRGGSISEFFNSIDVKWTLLVTELAQAADRPRRPAVERRMDRRMDARQGPLSIFRGNQTGEARSSAGAEVCAPALSEAARLAFAPSTGRGFRRQETASARVAAMRVAGGSDLGVLAPLAGRYGARPRRLCAMRYPRRSKPLLGRGHRRAVRQPVDHVVEQVDHPLGVEPRLSIRAREISGTPPALQRVPARPRRGHRRWRDMRRPTGRRSSRIGKAWGPNTR